MLEVVRERDGVTLQVRLQREQGRRTLWRWRGSAMGSGYRCGCKGSRDDALPGGGEGARWGQVTDATAKGAGMTHLLEVERECDGIRLRLRLQKERGRGTSWRQRGSAMGSGYRC